MFLWNTQGVLVDEVETPEFADNEIYSTGRKTDGSPEVVVFTEVSKNASNNGIIQYIFISPFFFPYDVRFYHKKRTKTISSDSFFLHIINVYLLYIQENG